MKISKENLKKGLKDKRYDITSSSIVSLLPYKITWEMGSFPVNNWYK